MTNKKIFSIISLVLAVLMVFALAACNKNDDTSTPDESTVNTTVAETTEAETTTAKPSSTAPSSTAATSSAATESNDANGGSDDTPVAVNPEGEEVIGAGSKSQPYLETPSSDMTVTTVKVPAGKALYYDIYRVGGKYLEINDPDAYVIYEGTRYDAYDGCVSFVVGSALASDAVSFQIGNAGSTAKNFTISFYDLYGSYNNPEIIDSFTKPEWITTTLYAGDDSGYTYQYIAEKNGNLRFYVNNSLDEFLFSATRVMYSDGMEIPVQKTFDDVQSDNNGNYIEIEVLKDETVTIAVSSYPMGSYYPAAEVIWFGTYV